MSLDFSLHRRKRNFPFPLFGIAATIGLAVLLLMFLTSGNKFTELFSLNKNDTLIEPIGYVLMISGFLSYMLGLGLIADIKADFKFLLHLSHLTVFTFVFLTGYFISSENITFFINGIFATVIIDNIFLLVFFLYQKRTSSSYSSGVMMIITTFKAIPAAIIIYRIYILGTMDFIAGNHLIDVILKIIFVMSVYISISANSVYILYINRKVR